MQAFPSMRAPWHLPCNLLLCLTFIFQNYGPNKPGLFLRLFVFGLDFCLVDFWLSAACLKEFSIVTRTGANTVLSGGYNTAQQIEKLRCCGRKRKAHMVPFFCLHVRPHPRLLLLCLTLPHAWTLFLVSCIPCPCSGLSLPVLLAILFNLILLFHLGRGSPLFLALECHVSSHSSPSQDCWTKQKSSASVQHQNQGNHHHSISMLYSPG